MSRFWTYKFSLLKPLLWMTGVFLSVAALAHPAAGVKNLVQQNSFIIVPINIYAPTLDAETVEHLKKSLCQPNSSPLSPAMHLNCKQLAKCQGDDCKTEYLPHGTAFLLENGQQLVSAWHVLFATHAPALTFTRAHYENKSLVERQSIGQIIEPSFVLLNSDHEIVFDTRTHTKQKTRYQFISDPLTPLYHSLGHKQNKPFGYFENVVSDVVVVSLPHSLGTGLNRTSHSGGVTFATGFGYDQMNLVYNFDGGRKTPVYELKKSLNLFLDFLLKPLAMPLDELKKLPARDQLFAMGFSEQEIQVQFEKHSSDVIEKSIAVTIAAQQRHMRDFQLEQHKQVFFSNHPVLPGQSGAPLVNARGQVVGLITNGFWSKSEDQSRIVSHGMGAYLFAPTEAFAH